MSYVVIGELIKRAAKLIQHGDNQEHIKGLITLLTLSIGLALAPSHIRVRMRMWS